MSDPETESEQEATQEDVLLLPGAAFFTEIHPVPSDLDPSELENFAELTLEGQSPFPIDQLQWGFHIDEAEGKLLIYATHRERLKQLGIEDLEGCSWAFPDFLPLVAKQAIAEPLVLLKSERSATAIHYSEDSGFPTSIVSRASLNELESGTDTSSRASVYTIKARADEKDLPQVRIITDDSEGDWSTLSHNVDQLWQADVRSTVFKKEEKGRRRLTSVIGRLTGYAALFAVLIVLLEIILLAGNFWSDKRNRVVEGRLPEVRRIEDKQSLINKLDQVAQSELRPVAMLEALNQNRPGGIYFTSTVTEGRNRITVDGIANTINELNAYTDALRNSGSFELIGTPQSITRSGRTTFTVTLDYFHRAKTLSESEEEG